VTKLQRCPSQENRDRQIATQLLGTLYGRGNPRETQKNTRLDEAIAGVVKSQAYVLPVPEKQRVVDVGTMPFAEAAEIIPLLESVQLTAYQDFGFVIRKIETGLFAAQFKAKAPSTNVDSFFGATPFEHLVSLIDEGNWSSGLWEKCNFIFNKFLGDKLHGASNAKEFVAASSENRANLLAVVVPDEESLILSVITDPAPTNTDFARLTESNLIFTTSSGGVDKLNDFLERFGHRGLYAMFGIILSTQVSPSAPKMSELQNRSGFSVWSRFAATDKFQIISTQVKAKEIEELEVKDAPQMVSIPGFPRN